MKQSIVPLMKEKKYEGYTADFIYISNLCMLELSYLIINQGLPKLFYLVVLELIHPLRSGFADV